jgi:GTP-binding protein Era
LRSGLVTLVGRPNVGKSTLVNQLVGSKVSITSSRPQTTRSIIRGVANASDRSWQLVLIDTPGLHKPRAELGTRLNRLVYRSLGEADVICFVIDATQSIGPGDRLIAQRISESPAPVVLAVNKVDIAEPHWVAPQLATAAVWDFAAYVPVSARTGKGVGGLVHELSSRLPEGPPFFPLDMSSDQSEQTLVGEIVREKFLSRLRDELPHSLHVIVRSIEEKRELVWIDADLVVERESQKGIVIGSSGEMLGKAGSAARVELEKLLASKVHLELRVRVEPDWQRRPEILDRLGFRDN